MSKKSQKKSREKVTNRSEARREKSDRFDKALLLGLKTQVECLQARLDSVIQNRFQFVCIEEVRDSNQITVYGDPAGEVFEIVTSYVPLADAVA